MRFFSVDLYDYFKIENKGNAGRLNCYILDNYESMGKNRKHPAMLVIPGGGYAFRSPREGEPVAVSYLPYGFNAFELEYSVVVENSTEPKDNAGYPAQLIEGAMAIAYIRENAKELGVDPKHIGAVGFSAGGHLCAMLATLTGEKVVADALGKSAKNCKPDAVILSYPVITSGEKAHRGSIEALAQGNKDIEEAISLEKRVTSDSVPAYIWCTATDTCVPPQNSIMMASAYLEKGVPFELHVFDKGVHGLSLANQTTCSEGDENLMIPHIEVWFKHSVEWLNRRGFVTTD